MSELDAVLAHASSGTHARDDDAERTRSVVDATPRTTPRALRVRTEATRETTEPERGAGETFADALEHEIERTRCETPVMTAGGMPLHAAVARGDREEVTRLVGGGRAEARTAVGETWPPPKEPLQTLIDQGSREAWMIRAPRVDQRNERGDTALVVACALDDSETCEEMVRILIDAGADPRMMSNGFAPVHWACQFGHVKAIEIMMLASKGIERVRAEDGSTPLLVAAEYGQMAVVRALLESGNANPMARDGRGRDLVSVLGAKMQRQSQSAKLELRRELFRRVPSLRLALLSHPDCEEHVSFKPHQESPERIVAIFEELRRVMHKGELAQEEFEETTDFGLAEPHDILRAHSEAYVRVLAELSSNVGHTPIAFTPYCQNQKGVPEKLQKDPENSDTFFSPGTLQAALRAAGGVIHAIDRVMDGKNRNAFVCCRPPGHHAGTEGATEGAPSSGFSILNNAMIGTYAIAISTRTSHAMPVSVEVLIAP